MKDKGKWRLLELKLVWKNLQIQFTGKNCKMHALIYPFTPKISIVILFTVCCTILVMLFGEFGLGSTNNPLVDIFIYSHHLSAWYCIYIVRRSSVLVTRGSYRVKQKNVFYPFTISWCSNVGSMSISEKLHTYPSPNTTLTLTC